MKIVLSVLLICMSFQSTYAIFGSTSSTVKEPVNQNYKQIGTSKTLQNGNPSSKLTTSRGFPTAHANALARQKSEKSKSSQTPTKVQTVYQQPVVRVIHQPVVYTLPNLRDIERERREQLLEQQRAQREYESRLREQELERQRFQNDLERQQRERLLEQQRVQREYESRLREQELERQRFQNNLERQERERKLQEERIRREIEARNRERDLEAQRLQNEYERRQREENLYRSRYEHDLRRERQEQELEERRLQNAKDRKQREIDLELQRKGYYPNINTSYNQYRPYERSYGYTHEIGEGYVYIR